MDMSQRSKAAAENIQHPTSNVQRSTSNIQRSRPDTPARDRRRCDFGSWRVPIGHVEAGLQSICKAIATLAMRFPGFEFVYAVHLNPNVRQPVFRILNVPPRTAPERDAQRRGNIHLIEPVPYLSFITLMARATIILTDSGGIQEEAPSLGKPILVMRETTERPEALTTGLVKLVGTDCERIVSEATTLLQATAGRTRLEDIRTDSTPPHHPNPYGDGKAADRIVAGCAKFLSGC